MRIYALALLLACGTASAEIYRCLDVNGTPKYQRTPCAGKETAGKIYDPFKDPPTESGPPMTFTDTQGHVYQPVRGGAVDTATGKFFPKVDAGYVDPETGTIITQP